MTRHLQQLRHLPRPRVDADRAAVLADLADAGVFRRDAVLVGTHAFVVLGNTLGVRWAGASLRTQDVDVAASRDLEVAVSTSSVDVPGVLESLEMGFLPVPGLDPAARDGYGGVQFTPSSVYSVGGRPKRFNLRNTGF